MPELVCELIISMDGFARGQRSPGFFGYAGPEFDRWLATNDAVPHRQLLGRTTYELLNDLPDEAKDDTWTAMTTTPGWLFSTTLEASEWPGLRVVDEDVAGFVRDLKRGDGPELRTVGSLSLVRQLLTAGLVDRLKLVVCPLLLPQTGVEPAFAGVPDLSFDLLSTTVLDGRVLLLEYRPAGPPPYNPE